jgi:hypothetical protein
MCQGQHPISLSILKDYQGGTLSKSEEAVEAQEGRAEASYVQSDPVTLYESVS